MPSRAGVTGTPVTPAQTMMPSGPAQPGFRSKISATAQFLIQGINNVWFGPQQPLQPIAQDAAGRVFDYMFGQNLIYNPKQGKDDGIPFGQLRLAAEGCDLVQMAIQRRKDQMSKLDWQITPVDEDQEPDDRCKKLTKFFQKPDRNHNWLEWQSLILDDHLTIDAATLYVRRTNGGDIYGFEPMDGALIMRLIDESGSTPDYPSPAYQQILKGMPAVDYTTEELIYRPRYISTNKLYGRSPVEQAIITINLAINRELSRLNFYTSGTMPEGFLVGPPSWTPQQLQDFQTSFNIAFAGNLEKRRTIPVVPNGMSFEDVKPEQLKDELDEWIARKICFAFSLPPTAFIKQNNRATGEQAQETADDEGLEPLKDWFRVTIMDEIIQNYMGFDDLCFSWVEEDETDPLIAAQIDTMLVDKGLLAINEARTDRGFKAVPGGEFPMLATATGFVPLNAYEDQMAQQQVTNDQAAAATEAMANRPIAAAGVNGQPVNDEGKGAGAAKPKSNTDNSTNKSAARKYLKKKLKAQNIYGYRHHH